MSKKKLSKGKIVLIVLAAIVVLFVVGVALTPTDADATTTAAGATTSADATTTEAEKTEAEEPTTKKEKLNEAIIDVIGEDNLITFNYVPENNFSLIKFMGSENLTSNMTINGFYLDIFNILESIQPVIDTDVDFNVVYPLQDAYGNSTDTIVIKATFTKETIQKINFENALSDNIPIIADEWWNHDAVNLSD